MAEPSKRIPDHPVPTYNADSLVTYHKTPAFLEDSRFQAAYRRGMDSGHHIARPRGSSEDLHIEWRVHVAIWAASMAAALPGDFVECGVNTGMMSLAICDYLEFNSTGKHFWLFDTYSGIPVEQISERERELGMLAENEANFSECYELARSNFAPFERAHVVRGRIPEVLGTVAIDTVAYLSIDLNIAAPEVAAFEHFWERLAPGAPVLLDDYGWSHHAAQREAMDALAAARGVPVLLLPTGQGMIIKPAGGAVRAASRDRRSARAGRIRRALHGLAAGVRPAASGRAAGGR